MATWQTRLVMAALISALALTPCGRALDKDRKKKLDDQIRKLRDLKVKGKRAGYKQKLEARAPML